MGKLVWYEGGVCVRGTETEEDGEEPHQETRISPHGISIKRESQDKKKLSRAQEKKLHILATAQDYVSNTK